MQEINTKEDLKGINTYMIDHKCILTTLEQEGTTLENNIPDLNYKGFVNVDFLSFYRFVKFLKSINQESITISEFNNKLYLNSVYNDIYDYRFIMPLIEESITENIKNSVVKLSVNLLIQEFKTYKLKDIKGLNLFIAFGTDYPAYFKVNDNHKFIIAPRIDNN